MRTRRILIVETRLGEVACGLKLGWEGTMVPGEDGIFSVGFISNSRYDEVQSMRIGGAIAADS